MSNDDREPLQNYVTFGTITDDPGGYDTVCRIIRTTSEESAIRIAEELGNIPATTTAYTQESLVALACEAPDYIDLQCEYCGDPAGEGGAICPACAVNNGVQA